MNIKFFEQVTLFCGLSTAELKNILSYFKPREVKEGVFIIKEDEIGSEMYILYHGTVQISKNLLIKSGHREFSNEDKTFVTIDEKSYSFFGEGGMLMNDKRSASVRALTDCTLYYIQRDVFKQFCIENYEMGFTIMRNIALALVQRLAKNNKDILKLTTALSIALKK